MRRKLIKQGGGGCVIYVPKKWLDLHNLIAGDELNIEENENGLFVSSDKIKFKKFECSYVVNKKIDFRSLIGGFYRLGYDKINLQFQDSKNYPKIEKAINYLQGYEITKVEANSCIIENIFNGAPEEIKKYYVRLNHIINTVHSIIQEKIDNSDVSSLDEIYSIRLNFVKLRDLIVRSIMKNPSTAKKYSIYITLVDYQWLVIRSYYYIYSEFCQSKKISKKDLSLFSDLNQFYNNAFANKNFNFFKSKKQFKILLTKLRESKTNYSSLMHIVLFAIDSSLSTLNTLKELFD